MGTRLCLRTSSWVTATGLSQSHTCTRRQPSPRHARPRALKFNPSSTDNLRVQRHPECTTSRESRGPLGPLLTPQRPASSTDVPNPLPPPGNWVSVRRGKPSDPRSGVSLLEGRRACGEATTPGQPHREPAREGEQQAHILTGRRGGVTATLCSAPTATTRCPQVTRDFSCGSYEHRMCLKSVACPSLIGSRFSFSLVQKIKMHRTSDDVSEWTK